MKINLLKSIWLISLILLASGLFLFNTHESTVANSMNQLTGQIVNPQTETPTEEKEAHSAADPLIEVAPIENSPAKILLPTPGAAQISSWHPPLYEVPLAINEHDHFYFHRPIAADEVNWPLANYRYGYFFPDSDIVHTGIDIDAPRGTPVLAAASGTVIWAGYGLYSGTNNPNDPYGLAVTIKHDFGYQGERLLTVYAHMDRIDVKVGDRVEDGDQLGIVGNTGFTTGPHLHFEVRLKDNDFFKSRNPELWLAPPQGWGVLVGKLTTRLGLPITLKEVNVRSLDSENFWQIRTYAPSSVNSDDFYNENLVLSDLPAGDYQLYFVYNGVNYAYQFEIFPGEITYFSFRENLGFSAKLPENSQSLIFE